MLIKHIHLIYVDNCIEIFEDLPFLSDFFEDPPFLGSKFSKTPPQNFCRGALRK